MYSRVIDVFRQLGDELDATWYTVDLAVATLQDGDAVGACELFSRCLRFWRDRMNYEYVAECFEGLAGVASMRHAPNRAHRLAAAAARHRKAVGLPASWWEIQHLRSWMEQPGDPASDTEIAEWFEQGQSMSVEEGIAYALEEHDKWAQSGDRAKDRILSRREGEIAMLLARGRSNNQIAEELVIARSTVERHVATILSKLDMASRTEVAVWAVRNISSETPPRGY